MIQTVSISELRHKVEEVMEMARDGPVMVLRHNKPVFIILSPDDWETLEQCGRSSATDTLSKA